MENSTASIKDNAWCQLNHQSLEKITLSAYVKYQVWMQQNKTQQYNGYFCVSIVFQIFQDFIILCNILFFQAWGVILRSFLIIIVFVICHCDSVIPLGCRRKSDFSNLTQAFKLHANWTIHLSKCLVHFESVSFS